MQEKVDLKLDWCSYKAAKYAVEHWHYSRRMPKSKLAKLGVWENNKFIGCVIFGVGATANIGEPYNLEGNRICELVRIALKNHVSNVSRIVKIAISILKKGMPKIALVVSYADSQQNHIGSIYQAGNWIYTGKTGGDIEILIKGRWYHRRGAFDVLGNSSRKGKKTRKTGCKYKYLYPLTKQMRKQIEPLAQPYPKRPASIDNDAPSNQPGEGGANPTAGLQFIDKGKHGTEAGQTTNGN